MRNLGGGAREGKAHVSGAKAPVKGQRVMPALKCRPIEGGAAARQFRLLFRVFLMRVVDLEMLSADGDTSRLVAQFVSIFAGISFALSVPMVMLVGVNLGLLTPEHFFIANTILASGIVAVLTWDAALPDKRDALVLGPLPVRSHVVFAAKIAAALTAPALAVAALNSCCGLLWPLLLGEHGQGFLHMMRAYPAYWIAVPAAGVFVFCALLMAQGLMANLLPRQVSLRLSPVVQAMVLCVSVVGYFVEPSLESTAALSAGANHRVLEWLPAYWFLGMFQQLNGTMSASLVWLAHRAWWALAISVAGACGTMLLAYVRMMPRVMEQPEIVPAKRLRWILRLGDSLTTAVTLFSLRTLLCSRQHRMILSFYLGIGLAVVAAYADVRTARTPAGAAGISREALFVSMLLIALSMMAMRVVAALPIALKANWIFRVTEVRGPQAYRAAVRRSWFVLGTATVGAAIAAALFAMYLWRPVVEHLVVAGLLALLLVEVLVRGFGKVPFACSYLPGKPNIHIAFWVSLILGLWALDAAAKFELRMLAHVGNWAWMVGGLAAAVALLRWMPWPGVARESIRYEEEYPPVVTSLNLG